MAALALLSLSLVGSAMATACGNPSISWKFDSTNHTNQTIEVNGTTRSFYVYKPADYSPNAAHPVMLSYHGFDETEQGQELISGFSEPGVNVNNTGLIAVYPAAAYGGGKLGNGSYRAWQGAPYSPFGVDDLAYTRAVVASLQENLCVDPNRIYASGKSNGAGFVNLLMCSNNTNGLFAAFAPVSAALYPTSLPDEGCNPGRKIPFINFHGLNDTVVPFYGRANDSTGNTSYALPNITVWRQNWAARNGCPQQTVSNLTALSTESVNNTAYVWNCADVSPRAVVHAFSVLGLEHSWPSTLPNDNGSTVHNETIGFPISEAVTSFNATPTYIMPFLNQFALNNSFDYSIKSAAVAESARSWVAIAAALIAVAGLV